MYSQNYPVVDNVVYPQQQQQQQFQQRLQSPLHPTMMQQQQQIPLQHRKEPLPSATDAKPNITLSISEIAEFSSTMVYLMWHARRQSVMDLHSNSKSDTTLQNNSSLEQTRVTADMANMTSAAFKKFCRQILSATQLSESVVLLSLKYIAMLLQNNPNIQGADGSEYRLFTVALMLANKFLDDNTFTNKTWSEVSGMKVTDLNIMELEFLDVLRFKLSVQKEEYERWRTALFGFRSQLMGVPVEIQRQKLMETMALSVGNTQQQWSQQYKHHQVQQQQQQQQHQAQQHHHQQQQQQHAAAVAAVTHNFFLFSKAQQQYPVQPTFNGPLTRVPLRIPAQPVYHNIRTTPSAPPNVLTPINVYDSRSNVVVPSTTTCSTQSQRYSTGPTSTIANSTANSRRPAETGYAPYQKQPQTTQPRIVMSSSSSASSNANTPIYPQQALPQPQPPPPQQQQQQQQKPSPFGTPVSNQQPFTRSYPSASVTNSNNATPISHHHPHHQTATSNISNSTNASTRASHRTSSLPPSGGLDLNVKNSSYYYATPSATPTNIAYSNTSNNYPTTTSYYVDPATSMTTPVTTMATSPADYNPYNTSNTASSAAGMTDVYNRPMVPRSTSYKNVPPQHQLPVTPNGHYMQQQQQQQQRQHDLYTQSQLQQPATTTSSTTYNGPTLEDPLTAIDSYRAHRH